MTPIEVERRGSVVVARAVKDVDAANAEEVRLQLAEAVDERCDALVLDLDGARYVDSAGIDMLFRLAALLRDRRSELRVVIRAGSPLRRLAEIVSLSAGMGVDDDVPSALEAVAEARSRLSGDHDKLGQGQ